jgi:FkbM family methyltransferase
MNRILRASASFVRDLKHFGLGVVKAHFGRIARQDEVTVQLRGVGVVTVRPQDSDLSTFRQVFIEGQYDLGVNQHGESLKRRYDKLLAEGQSPVIIDAGANVGAAAIWFARSYPQAKIFSVEPEPRNAALCRRNTAAFPNVTVLEGAIAGREGNVTVQVATKSWGAVTTRTGGEGGVRSYTIDEIVGMAAADSELFIVKIDIEGFESDLFSANVGWVGQPSAIIVEPHDWAYPGQGTSLTMQRSLFPVGLDLLLLGENLVFVRNDDLPLAGARAFQR